MDTDFNKLCTPAKLYFAFSLLSCIIMLFNRMSLLAVFSKLIFAFLWTFVLGWLCKKRIQGYFLVLGFITIYHDSLGFFWNDETY